MQVEKEFRDGSQLFLIQVATFAEIAIRNGHEDEEEIRKVLHQELDRAINSAHEWDSDYYDLQTVRVQVIADMIGTIIKNKVAEHVRDEMMKGDEPDGNYS